MAESAAPTAKETVAPPPPNGVASGTATTPVPPVVSKPTEGPKVDASGKPLVEAAPVEKAPETPAAPPAPTPQQQRDSQRFAVLNQQTKKLVQDRALFKREREQFQAERQKADAELKEARELKALMTEALRNPDALQKKIYGDRWYETLTDFITADRRLTPELVAKDIDQRVGQRISELERRQQTQERARLEAERRTQAQADAQYERDFSSAAIAFVTKNAEKYQFTARTNNHWRVPDLIKRNYDATGNVITVEEAAAAVEKHIAEVEAPLYSPPRPPEAPKPAATPKPAVNEPPRSLSNDMATGTPASFFVGPSSDDEAVKRAAAAYRANRSVRSP